MKITFDKPVSRRKAKEALDFLKLQDEVKQDQKLIMITYSQVSLLKRKVETLKAEFEAHRRLQGVYNVLFGLVVGVLVVMGVVLCNSSQV